TPDLVIANDALSQLSYGPMTPAKAAKSPVRLFERGTLNCQAVADQDFADLCRPDCRASAWRLPPPAFAFLFRQCKQFLQWARRAVTSSAD
ncbi:MAG: hypothetical protein ACR2OX_10070, partial [Methyloligellaceae bacterium]